jgi:hypothetical protein
VNSLYWYKEDLTPSGPLRYQAQPHHPPVELLRVQTKLASSGLPFRLLDQRPEVAFRHTHLVPQAGVGHLPFTGFMVPGHLRLLSGTPEVPRAAS